MLKFLCGVVVGIWLAQNYDMPDVGKEFGKLQKRYRKSKDVASKDVASKDVASKDVASKDG